jgi:3-isopropylmalate dehydrogenase
MAMILSAAMMLDWLGHKNENAEAREAGRALDAAVSRVLSEARVRSADLGGSATTLAVAEAVAAALRDHPKE